MKNSNKMFALIETVLIAAAAVLVALMFLGNTGKNIKQISVIVPNSDDNQWTAFKYGLRMAAEDYGVEMFVVGTEGRMTVKEQESAIEQEIENGADAVIVRPVPGNDTEAMLKRIENSVPVMLAGSAASADKEESALPVTEADNYAMGQALAEELLEDYAGSLSGKTIGILSEAGDLEAETARRQGFGDALRDTGVKILWDMTESGETEKQETPDTLPKTDLVAALDDVSLTAAGQYAASNALHGAVVYGIGHSTEAVYYLDTGYVECLVVPDEFSLGYQSLSRVAEDLQHHFRRTEEKEVKFTVIRREELFTEANQELIFTMSQ